MSAGRLLARLTVIPALLVMAWLVVTLPLLFGGVLRPGPAIVIFVPVAAALLWAGLRRSPADDPVRVPWWSTVGVVVVALAFLVLQALMCSEQIIVRRDPASYVQFATWLTDHGSLPIPQMRQAFGGGDPVLTYDSPAFYADGGSIVPQFMAGLPLVLTLGGWLGGTHGMVLMAPLLGAGAVLAFGGVVARFAGPRWAPAGALMLALTTPMIWGSRSTLSELPALVLLLGGLAMLDDAALSRPRVRAFLAGLAFGLIVLVRIDALRDVFPLVVIAGLLIGLAPRRRRRDRRGLPANLAEPGADSARERPVTRMGWPLAAGLLVGAGAGLGEGFRFSRPYLRYLHASLDPLLMMTAALVVATALMAVALRVPATGERLRRLGRAVAGGPVPGLGAVLTLLVMTAFAVRPLVQTVRRVPKSEDDRLNAQFIEQVQRFTHLPVDGARQYSELSLYWVIWYVGIPVVLLASFGAALLVRRLLRGGDLRWFPPLAVIGWTTVTTLYRPAITPDHPWAARRLLGVVIPGMILLALWAASWAMRRVRRAGYGPVAVRCAAVAVALLLFLPIPLSSHGVLTERTEQHEIGAVRGMCSGIGGAGRSVLVVDHATSDRLLQVIRGMCGLPAARVNDHAGTADVRRVVGKIYAVGRRPVVLGAQAGQVSPYGQAVQVMRLRTRQDERTLTSPPDSTWGLTSDVWIAEPPRP
ncbi:hypothetical protein [Actinomadura atramentaria]|uniref:hypothetical protein n=1 Tax=Actinomadura atramentaria TaxID=1990 RepID=UPI0003651776|nr:hypothetical protein [Actinomadura atramentaria]